MTHRLLALAALAAATIAAAPASAQSWQGRYVYDQDLGRNAAGAGAAVSVEHRLTIGRDGSCRIDAEGYQTNERILCTATPERGALQVRFLGYVGGGLRNQYGVQVYRARQPLFRLERRGRGLMTTLQGYRANREPPVGRYFRRV